jgi:hypothetical protein
MATKTDRPGLLSKMALFVRNPTKDWSELDRPQVEQDTGYDKQGLKAMIERKRQNDFVRKREFDQLRKLRSRGVTAVAGLGRPSVFQSSLLTDPDGRAVTLKKIDEIEAQMSKQWWKGKQDASIAQGVSFPVASPVAPKAEPDKPKAPVLPEPLSVTEQFSTTAAFDSRTESVQPNASEFVSTQMGDGMDSVPSRRALSSRRSALRKRPNAGDGTHGQDTDGGFSTSNMFAIDVEDMATDPELEEAAIRFANGDDEGAEKGLLSALRSSTEAPGSANAWAAALLDLYRATRNKAGFDSATSEFAHCFEAVVPHWQAIGEEPAPELSPQPTVASAPDTQAEGSDHAVGAIWSSPAELVAQSMEELRDAMASNPTPWHMDWSRLVRISDDAMPLMGGLFSSLCSEPVALRFSGAQKLVDTLQAMTPSGNQDVPSDWWSVRLNVLRTLQMLDEFELAALDYCVTYEVSPPAWQEARCQYANIEDLKTVATAAIPIDGLPSQELQTPGSAQDSDGLSAVRLELQGNVLGDATHALSGYEGQGSQGGVILVSCENLIRVDFSAAGSILNWVATRQAEGSQVQFRDVQRLVAAFFNVIGINEHARVVPRAI